MASLLDLLGSSPFAVPPDLSADPNEVARFARGRGVTGLAQGLLAAGAPSRTPVSMGQALGQGLLGFSQGQDEANKAMYSQGLLGIGIQKQRQAAAEAAKEAERQKIIESEIAKLPPQEQAIARANPDAFFKAKGDAMFAQPKLPEGYKVGQDGNLTFIPGGPADPAVKGTLAAAGREPNATWETVDLGNGQKAQRNSMTGELREMPGVGGKENFARADKLRDEFNAGSKEYITVRDAYTRLGASAQNPSPAGDMALLYNYVRMLDPGSVVRESEFAMAAQAGSYGEQVKAQVNKLLSGERLTDSMRQDFTSRAKQIYGAQQMNYKSHETRYKGLSEKFGIDPAYVISDLGAGVPDLGATQPAQAPTPAPAPMRGRGDAMAAPKAITSEAEYNALPSGAEYIAPDGKKRRKR
jgi:hypothetical protein